jgi:lipoyl(octanoyl) transferase 2
MTHYPNRLVHILKTGLISYSKGLQIQSKIVKNILNHGDLVPYKNVLVLTEHQPVYTIGLRTKNYPADVEEKLKQLGADFYKTNRGGLITFHGPGQLVAYPIINLKYFQPSMRWYVAAIEQTIIDTCEKYSLIARTTCDTGVWIDDRKVCAIGVHGSRFVTSHGLALNCNTDLTWFDHIVPCGIEGKGVTSLSKETSRNITIDRVVPNFVDSFRKTFECEIVDLDYTNRNLLLSDDSVD